MNPFFLGLNNGFGFGMCMPWGGFTASYAPLLGFGGSNMYMSLYSPTISFGFGGTRFIQDPFMAMPMMPSIPFYSMNYMITPQCCMDTFVSSSSSPGGGGGGHSQVTYNANELRQKWSKKAKNSSTLTAEFCQKVIDISKEIKCNADDLMALMFSESSFNPSSLGEVEYTDKKTGEKKIQKNAGLIQFGSGSRKDLGFAGNTDEERIATIQNMSAMEQLDYVKEFFKNAKKIAGIPKDATVSTGTLAALAFTPAHANQEVQAVEGDQAYTNNKNLDKNNDKKITKTELAERLNSIK